MLGVVVGVGLAELGGEEGVGCCWWWMKAHCLQHFNRSYLTGAHIEPLIGSRTFQRQRGYIDVEPEGDCRICICTCLVVIQHSSFQPPRAVLRVRSKAAPVRQTVCQDFSFAPSTTCRYLNSSFAFISCRPVE